MNNDYTELYSKAQDENVNNFHDFIKVPRCKKCEENTSSYQCIISQQKNLTCTCSYIGKKFHSHGEYFGSLYCQLHSQSRKWHWFNKGKQQLQYKYHARLQLPEYADDKTVSTLLNIWTNRIKYKNQLFLISAIHDQTKIITDIHLQGCLSTVEQIDIDKAKQHWDDIAEANKPCYIQVMKKDWQANVKYCLCFDLCPKHQTFAPQGMFRYNIRIRKKIAI